LVQNSGSASKEKEYIRVKICNGADNSGSNMLVEVVNSCARSLSEPLSEDAEGGSPGEDVGHDKGRIESSGTAGDIMKLEKPGRVDRYKGLGR
jgi:hypothetical protein